MAGNVPLTYGSIRLIQATLSALYYIDDQVNQHIRHLVHINGLQWVLESVGNVLACYLFVNTRYMLVASHATGLQFEVYWAVTS